MRGLLNQGHGSVVVAVIAVRMMQLSVDDIVHMIPVRDRFVSASRPVYMTGCSAFGDSAIAAVGIGRADLDNMLVVVHRTIGLMRVVQVAFVEVVDVVTMTDRLMTTAWAVLVVVLGMDVARLVHLVFLRIELTALSIRRSYAKHGRPCHRATVESPYFVISAGSAGIQSQGCENSHNFQGFPIPAILVKSEAGLRNETQRLSSSESAHSGRT